jgi:hypothetical protein
LTLKELDDRMHSLRAGTKSRDHAVPDPETPQAT